MPNNELELEVGKVYDVLENNALEEMRLTAIDMVDNTAGQTILRMWLANQAGEQCYRSATEVDDFIVLFSKRKSSVYGSHIKSYEILSLRTKLAFPGVYESNSPKNAKKVVDPCRSGHSFATTGMIWTFCKVCNITGELDKKLNEYVVKI